MTNGSLMIAPFFKQRAVRYRERDAIIYEGPSSKFLGFLLQLNARTDALATPLAPKSQYIV